MKIFKQYWFLIFLISQPFIYAQALNPEKYLTQHVLNNWTTEKGLPQNSAYSIIQTKDGYIWFGTEEGFVKFDGFRFTVYNPDVIPEMKSSLVVTLMEDREGNLWVGTFDGLLKYTGKHSRLYTTKDGLINNMIRSLYEDESGRIWVGTSEGLSIIENGKIRKFTKEKFLNSEIIYKIIGDKNGKIYLATASSGVVIIDIAEKEDYKVSVINTKKGLLSNYVRSLLLNDEKLFVGTDKGLDLIVNNKVEKFPIKKKLLNIQVMDIIDDKGNLYLATQKGLCRIVNTITKFYSLDKNLEMNMLLDLFIDRENNLWIGSYNNGIYRMRDGNFTTFSLEEGLKEKFIRAVTQNKEGIWVASNNNYLSLIKGNEVKNYFLRKEENSNIQTIVAQNDSIWIGTRVGLYLFKNGILKKIKNCSFSVTALFVDSKNRLLIGCGNGGLYQLNSDKLISLSNDGKSSTLRIRFIAEDKKGNLFLGTIGQGLAIYDGKYYQYFDEENGLPSNLIYFIHLDQSGIIWLTISGSGIVHFDGNKFSKITKKDGLPTNEVQTILEDDEGNFWCGFNNGIFRVSKYELEKLISGKITEVNPEIFNKDDGLKNSECNGGFQGTALKDSDRNFWFATIDGITFVNPKKLKASNYFPPVYISRILCNFEPIEIYSEITAPLGTNILRFNYIVASYIQPFKLKVKYILEGYENEWHEVRNRRIVYYNNLEPGEYKFRVKVSNYKYEWNNQESSVKIIIPPYFYQALVFKVLSPVLLLSLIFIYVKWRVRKQEKLTHKLEEMVKLRTEELNKYASELEKANKTKDKFFSIISHDLRNPIQSISSISEFLYNNRNELSSSELDDMLIQIKNSSITLYNLIENLLEWSRIQTNRMEYKLENFNLYENIKSVVSILESNANQKEIEFIIDAGRINVYADKTSVDSILLNLISNAIKFSYPKGKIIISAEENEKDVKVCIKDNGIGISKEEIEKIFLLDTKFTKSGTAGEKGTGLGLVLCKEHIERNGGNLWIESKIDKGTSVYFTLQKER